MDKNLKIEYYNSLKKFRDVSIYFYLTSFLFITIFFIFYLYASKNNKSCQYGSTLFCNTEKTYPINSNSSNSNYLQITFSNTGYPSSGLCVVGYPYSTGVSYYNIDYYFDAIPSGINSYGDVGISFNNDYGASLYLNNNNDVLIANSTLFILENNPYTNSTLEFLYSTSNNVIEYIYLNINSTINNIDNSKFISSALTTYSSTNPALGNWITLLQNNKDQHNGGCSSGNSSKSGCACVDPSFVSSNSCENLVLNKTTGIYCPPDNLNCALCSPDNSTECGYLFCTPYNYTIPINNNNNVNYQNAQTKGLKNPTDDSYTIGKGGQLLSSYLNNTEGYNGLTSYAVPQGLNFCGGTTSSKNNINNGTDINPPIPSSFSTGYNPQFATHPKLNSNNNFDF